MQTSNNFSTCQSNIIIVAARLYEKAQIIYSTVLELNPKKTRNHLINLKLEMAVFPYIIKLSNLIYRVSNNTALLLP